ncbi:arylamine N-acetyltransferase family protein [Parasphingopyxis lamellibrachiae]|uniref:N-hydroxyarylamine O-acetyltransferase n=1 Tax=Parasphingopyxis lamellibrachiae TaxID=680125 RepID=A0A3D9FEK7_9SPHN|nr:arylamine N-acetyltransferase [Parasphingopyxis lamellibrachiae]RED16264.1 N-hydroxyarylamine O-acetyltransferase [Parasphingopyxis lamellibrachiae]
MSAVSPTATQLSAYLDTIGFTGMPKTDLATLTAVHRGHVENIVWENIDVALGRPLTRDPVDAFEKIVDRKRGGWCYEMNGLMGWMLEAIGFQVTWLAGAVNRAARGDEMIGNHLVMLVQLDRVYVADAGFGKGLIEPAKLTEGSFAQGPAHFRLEKIDSIWWRFHGHEGVMPPSFDFAPGITDISLLEARNQWQQSHPDSPFRRTLVVNGYRKGRLEMLTLPVHETLNENGLTMCTLEAPEDLETLLSQTFGIPMPREDIARLWAMKGTAPG